MIEDAPDDPGQTIVPPAPAFSTSTSDWLPLSSFLGRHDEVATVHALVMQPDVRLVTLTGPGGAGKTRLARRVMDEVADERVRAFFVALATIRQPELILPASAGALGLADQQPVAHIQEFLNREPTLLVLDNLEHLLADAAAFVHQLLHSCPGLTILGTSRTHLSLSGERVFPIAGLDPQDARAVFIARAQATRPDFVATPGNLATIDAICDQIDRLPLAIELAAARVNVLPLAALRDRLERRLDLLTGGPRDAPDRQRTMRTAIAWSYDLLPDHLQPVFRRLGVFVGGFSVEAAGAVVGNPATTLDDIGALVAASLVIPVATASDAPRFTMLETIREFALSQLIEHEEDHAARTALFQHFLHLAERFWAAPTGREVDFWLDKAINELGNIRATLDWAIDHHPVETVRLVSSLYDLWSYRTGAAEGRLWLDRALAAAPTLPPPLRALMLWASGGFARDLRDLALASEYLTEATRLAQAIDDTRLLSYASGILAETLQERGDLDRALVAQEIEWRTAEILGEPLALAIATLNRGMAAMAEGDLPRAQELFQKAVSVHRQSGSKLGVAIAQSFLSEAMLDSGDLVGAADQAREAIRGFASATAWVQMSSNLIRLSAMAAGHVPEISVRLLAAVASIFDSAGITPRPDDKGEIERTITQTRSALSETAFATAWESGSHLALDAVLGLADEIVVALAQPTTSPSHGLSPREIEVLRLVATGKSNRAIAEEFSISERTVENHVFHILTKLDVDTRTAAATWAVRNGLT